jgi:hypothetical protein
MPCNNQGGRDVSLGVDKLRQQLRQHSVALLSLVIALTGLAYNTWRNEQTEANRNVRTAGVALLLKLGELDRVVFFSHYDHDQIRGNPRSGWAYVLTIRDLGMLTGTPVDTVSEKLVVIWEQNWSRLGESNESADRISTAIDDVRTNVLSILGSLD